MLVLILSIVVLATPALAVEPESLRVPMPRANWDTSQALDEASRQGVNGKVSAWLEKAANGRSPELLTELKNSPESGSPSFESQLFQLATGLAETSLDPATDELLHWLADYPVQVLVAHEEHPAYGVPLFNFQAAAIGSLAERNRLRGEKLSTQLLASKPHDWSRHYLLAGDTQREGFTRALKAAPAGSLDTLAASLPAQLESNPELASAVGVLAGRLSDPGLFLVAYQHGSGTESAPLLREALWQLDAADRALFLQDILNFTAPNKAALGISVLAPSLQTNPQVSESMLGLLDHPELGAAAALALAGHPDRQVQSRLQDMLNSGGLASKRAALALDQIPAGEGE